MKLTNEKLVRYYKYDADYEPHEAEALKKIANERFVKDERAQIEYAVRCVLEDKIKELVDGTSQNNSEGKDVESASSIGISSNSNKKERRKRPHRTKSDESIA